MNQLNTKGEMLSPTNLYDVARKRVGELKKIEKEKRNFIQGGYPS